MNQSCFPPATHAYGRCLCLTLSLVYIHARIQGGAKGALAPPPSPQNIAPQIVRRGPRGPCPPPPGGQEGLAPPRGPRGPCPPPRGPRGPCPPPLQNPGSAYDIYTYFLLICIDFPPTIAGPYVWDQPPTMK